MTQITKPNTFTNQTTADATQVNADFDTLYQAVNGNLDDSNMKPGSLSNAIAAEGVTQSQTKGIPYASDLYGGPFLLNGYTVTKSNTNANQANVDAGIALLKQFDNSLRRMITSATQFFTSVASANYYLDLNSDGTWSWGNVHSTKTNYLTVATITTDASGNISTINQNKDAYKIVLLQSAVGPVTLEAEPPNVMAWIR